MRACAFPFRKHLATGKPNLSSNASSIPQTSLRITLVLSAGYWIDIVCQE